MAVYVGTLFQALWVWLKRDADPPLPNVKVTVVVPFRNEEENLCNSLRVLIIHQFLYPLYVVYVGLMANFGNYRWKGRSYRVGVK